MNGPSSWPNHPKVQGFVIPMSTRTITSVFSPNGQGLGQPHDVAVSKDGNQVYVVEISRPYKVWKFVRNTQRTGKGSQDADSGSVGVPQALLSDDNAKNPQTVVVVPAGEGKGSQGHPQHPLLPKLPDETQSKKLDGKSGVGDDSFNSSVIIMAFLTIPLLLLVGIGAMLRLRSSCKFNVFFSFGLCIQLVYPLLVRFVLPSH